MILGLFRVETGNNRFVETAAGDGDLRMGLFPSILSISVIVSLFCGFATSVPLIIARIIGHTQHGT